MFRITLTNNTGTANTWTSGSTNDSSVPANTEVVRYAEITGNSHAIGVNNGDTIVFSNLEIGDVCTGSVVSTKAQITADFYVKVEALVGDREIVLFEHTGTA